MQSILIDHLFQKRARMQFISFLLIDIAVLLDINRLFGKIILKMCVVLIHNFDCNDSRKTTHKTEHICVLLCFFFEFRV